MRLSVRDSGPGIPAHEMEAALKAFARGSLATRSAIDGAGLGLPIVNGLVKLHGGELEISSQPGAGTVVTAVFPKRRVVQSGQHPVLFTADVASESQRRLIALTA